MTRLPCLRYKITDSTLFRTGLDYIPFYRRHPMVGPMYGDFHIAKQWVGPTTRILEITQDSGESALKVEVREFYPPADENALDLKGRSMYFIPWAISDPEKAVETINAYIDESIGSYIDATIDDTDGLVMDVFHAAYRLSIFPTPVCLPGGRNAQEFVWLTALIEQAPPGNPSAMDCMSIRRIALEMLWQRDSGGGDPEGPVLRVDLAPAVHRLPARVDLHASHTGSSTTEHAA
jgi:hypothetical protein